MQYISSSIRTTKRRKLNFCKTIHKLINLTRMNFNYNNKNNNKNDTFLKRREENLLSSFKFSFV
jgi:hypothetical protein